jgi:hypothetical protein
MKRFLQGTDTVASCYLFAFFLLVLLSAETLKNLVVLRVPLVTPPSRNDGVNQDHIEGSSVKREFTSICIQAIIIMF